MSGPDILGLVLLAAIWGAAFLFMRMAAPPFGPLPLIWVRVSVAAVCLMACVGLTGGLREVWRHRRALFVVGLFNAAIPFSLLAYASLALTAGFTALLNSTTPLMVALVGALAFGHRPRPHHWVGMGVSLGGVAVLSWGRMSFHPGGSGWAIVASLLAALCYGIGTNLSRRDLVGVAPITSSAGSVVGASLALAPWGAATWPSVAPSAGVWAAAAALGLVCTAAAYVIFYHLVQSAGAHRAASVTFLVPVFAMTWSSLFLHEGITPRMVVASLVILAGTAIAIDLLPLARLMAFRPCGAAWTSTPDPRSRADGR